MTYTVSKVKGSDKWFAHPVGHPEDRKGKYGTKKEALHVAAECMGISYKEYMKLRRKGG